MVLTTVKNGTLVGTTAPYAAGNYGASVNRAGGVAQMQAGIRAVGASYGKGASRAGIIRGVQQITPGVAGLAGLFGPAAEGLANFRSPGFVGGSDGIGMNQGLPAERLTGVARDLGFTANAGYRGINVQNPGATFAGQTAQVGAAGTPWAALAPAMDGANGTASPWALT